MADALEKQLQKHLDESIAMEQSVLRLLDSMLKTTEDPPFQRALDEHRRTTERHVERLQERLAAYGGRRSLRRQAGGVVVSRGKAAIDLVRPQRPGRNARDAFATEQMEVAAYELLERIARRAGDEATADVARQNRAEDEAMAGLIARNWETFAEQSLSGDGQGGGTERARALKERATSAVGMLRNPIALGVASVAGGVLLGRRLQRQEPREAPAPEPRKRASLATLTKPELQTRAREAGIEVKGSMTKQELIDALERRGES